MSINVPLQEAAMHYPTSGQFQYTVLEAPREMPKDHFIWSLCCLLYYNPFCLGFAALVNSVKARDRKVLGDIEGARSYASTARTLNIISTVLFCFSIIITIILMAVLMDQAVRLVQSFQDFGRSQLDDGNGGYSGGN